MRTLSSAFRLTASPLALVWLRGPCDWLGFSLQLRRSCAQGSYHSLDTCCHFTRSAFPLLWHSLWRHRHLSEAHVRSAVNVVICLRHASLPLASISFQPQHVFTLSPAAPEHSSPRHQHRCEGLGVTSDASLMTLLQLTLPLRLRPHSQCSEPLVVCCFLHALISRAGVLSTVLVQLLALLHGRACSK